MITVQMLFFAHLQDMAGSREIANLISAGTSQRYAHRQWNWKSKHRVLRQLLDHVRVAVNAEFAGPDTVLRDGDEVAWMPPMSGGSESLPSAHPFAD